MNPRYRKLGECLGEGSYKTVSKAIDAEEGKEVAYNEVRLRRYEEETQAGSSFSKEIALLKNINHPNIIKILDYWFTDENFVFVTELMSGGTLRDYLTKTGPLSSKLIRKWARQILEGLHYLHTRDPPIIHRDIKNENIFVNSSLGEIKIGDLGIARERKHKRYTIVGTPNFMAREMFEGEGYSEKVDIYALGMCLIEMATGAAPYAELSDSNEVYRSVLQGVLPRALQAVTDGCLRSLIMSCLVALPHRFSAEQCLAHHFFRPEEGCAGDCLPRGCATVLPLDTAAGGMELSLLSLRGSVMTFQLALRGTLRFIKFDYDLESDSLEKVAGELLDEQIIDGEGAEAFKRLLERGIEKAQAKQERGHIHGGIIELDGGESLGEEVMLHPESDGGVKGGAVREAVKEAGPGEAQSAVCCGKCGGVCRLPSAHVAEAGSAGSHSPVGFGVKTIEMMREIDEEMRRVETQRLAEAVRSASVRGSEEGEGVAVREGAVEGRPGSPREGTVSPVDDRPADQEADAVVAAGFAQCHAKYRAGAALLPFVLDAAAVTGRSEDSARGWLKALRDQDLETVSELRLLVYEDWERLPLTVFASRAMQNMLFGVDGVPLREKQLPQNPRIADYDNQMAIRDFLAAVCAGLGRADAASSWEDRLLAQDIRTVAELKSLHHDDWARLGLSVFAHRILKNIIFRKGRVEIEG